MAKNNFIPLVGGGTQMPASAEAVAADILRLDGAVSDLAEDVGTIENWDAGDIPYDSSENYNDGTVGGSLNDLKSAIGENGATILAAYPTDNASGAVASFADGAAVPVKSLVVNIEPVQSGSGDPAPNNVRPISGWTEVKIWREVTHDTSANPTLTIDLDGTFYGGTLDVLTGVLTVDRVITVFDGSNDEAWIAETISQGQNFYVPVSDAKKPQYGEGLLCNLFPASPVIAARKDTVFISGGGNLNAVIGDTLGISSVPELRTWLASNNLTICYEPATSTTYQLTPTEVSTLLGANNIWADTGDVSVTYRADTTLYIDKLTGSTEEDMIADAPIASGKYFLVGNRLFLSTASIAAGATLTPGTNCTETNLAAALNAINS